MYQGLIRHYSTFLPIEAHEKIVSLCEGQTKLIRAHQIENRLPGIEVYLKFDGLNPTGSFKDRGMTMAVTKALSAGSKGVICASTGNTSASMAAYAARAGLKSYMLIPDGKIALGKLAQAVAYGAEIIPISGNFDAGLEMVRQICEQHPLTLVNSINPYRIEGQKTAAFELVDDLGDAPDYLFIPVGNAGNITAYWKGFKEYAAHGRATKYPRLFGYQAEGSAPMVKGERVLNPDTVATAIRIGNPASWSQANLALSESKGQIDAISDEVILQVQKQLAASEGVFAEPASCISVAGLMKAYDEGKIESGAKVVCVLTGNGLKDTDIIMKSGFTLPQPLDDLQAVEARLVRGL